MSTIPTRHPGGTPYEEVQAGEEFVQLRRTFRRFVFPMTAAVPRLVLPLRPAVGLRARLHEHQGVRQHQHRPASSGSASSSRRSHHDRLRALGRPRVRPAAERAARAHRGRTRAMSAASPPGLAPRPPNVGNPALNIAIFALFVLITLAIVIRASRNNRTAADYYAGGRVVHRAAERHRHLGRLPVGRVVPRHRRRDRAQRLRRLPVLDRLPRRVARRAAARRRAAAQHRPVHDGRRPVLPPPAAPGPDGRGDLDPRRLFFYLLAQMAGAGGLVALLLGVDGRARARASSSPSSASS